MLGAMNKGGGMTNAGGAPNNNLAGMFQNNQRITPQAAPGAAMSTITQPAVPNIGLPPQTPRIVPQAPQGQGMRMSAPIRTLNDARNWMLQNPGNPLGNEIWERTKRSVNYGVNRR